MRKKYIVYERGVLLSKRLPHLIGLVTPMENIRFQILPQSLLTKEGGIEHPT
jgi:hypothetical protein